MIRLFLSVIIPIAEMQHEPAVEVVQMGCDYFIIRMTAITRDHTIRIVSYPCSTNSGAPCVPTEHHQRTVTDRICTLYG